MVLKAPLTTLPYAHASRMRLKLASRLPLGVCVDWLAKRRGGEVRWKRRGF